MRVEGYIKQLLYRYECVIVPEFGAFVTHKHASRYQEDEHTFMPPSKKITFNKAIQNHDGLLVETIAKAEALSFESAKYKVQLFVKDFQDALQVERELAIPQLGKFFLDEEENLSFQPVSTTNYYAASFGLDAVQVDAVSKAVEEAQKEVENEVKVKTLPPFQEEEVKKAYNQSNVASTSKKRSKPYLKYAAVGVLAVGLASFTGLYQYSNYVISHNDSEIQKAESLLQDRIQSAEFNYTLSELPMSTIKLEVIKPKYHIVAGAYRVRENALKKVDFLKSQGHEATLIDENTYGLDQVAFSSYVSKSEALRELRKIKGAENPDAWLYVKQL